MGGIAVVVQVAMTPRSAQLPDGAVLQNLANGVASSATPSGWRRRRPSGC